VRRGFKKWWRDLGWAARIHLLLYLGAPDLETAADIARHRRAFGDPDARGVPDVREFIEAYKAHRDSLGDAATLLAGKFGGAESFLALFDETYIAAAYPRLKLAAPTR
jgi:hypothetical protein